MATLPSLFISHGSPELPLRPSPAHDFLKQLGQQIEKPQAILVISAHWNTPDPVVSGSIQPQTLHDFSGFPAELYQLNYPAPGAPQLAERTHELLQAAHFQSQIVVNRGLDHGAWNPLLLMYPDASIPVTQLSIQPHLDSAYHLRLGQAIAPLKEEGILILASGTATHNLWEIGGYGYDASPPVWVTDFAEWLNQNVIEGNIDALIHYRDIAPSAQRNHPSAEHLLPLFVALGAGGERSKAIQLHQSYTYGVLSMASYAFYPESLIN
jgi:4,5-DOPA dioxygenase extradiol